MAATGKARRDAQASNDKGRNVIVVELMTSKDLERGKRVLAECTARWAAAVRRGQEAKA
jgi:hypothetical protein